MECNKWKNFYGRWVGLCMTGQYTTDAMRLVRMIMDRYMSVLWIDKSFSVDTPRVRSWFPLVEIPEGILEVEPVSRIDDDSVISLLDSA